MFSRLVRSVLLCVVAVAPLAPAAAQSGAGGEIQAVVELYTSQGCSSCPPADALLRKLAERKDLVTLTLPVDYWDYLGWKDTLASARHGERQRAYAKLRGDGLIYTPQVVVNGRAHANGAKLEEIEAALAETGAQFKAYQVPLKVRMEQGTLVIETGGRQTQQPIEATIWLALVQKSAEVVVKKGENSGRKLVYVNVVRELTPIGMWSGKAETIRLDRQAVTRPGTEACAVLIQKAKAGPILGAAWLPEW